MKILFLIILITLTISFLSNCSRDKNDEPPVKPYTTGKNRFTLTVDGGIREYYVHVPVSYNATAPFPVVFMLHGSGGNGEKFYNISGWKELGEIENIITVFPSSAQYPCVFDDGAQKPNAEKWNSYELKLCNGGKPKDDIKFLSLAIDTLKQKYNLDEKRIYLVGFSNGGEMASRVAIELSDKIAAVVACAGALPVDTSFSPKRKLPVLLQAGNSDNKLMANLGTANPLPMDFTQLFASFPAVKEVTNTFTNSFALNNSFSTGGNPNTFLYADYTGISGKTDNVFRFMLVKGLDHNYPNGSNHPLKGAEVHWEWLETYRLP
jgi:polyhydroxybutyrate depolymerase